MTLVILLSAVGITALVIRSAEAAACTGYSDGNPWTISTSCEIAAGTYTPSSFTINSGVTVTTALGAVVVIEVTGDITISSTAVFSANALGNNAQTGTGAPSSSYAGAGYGGNGGTYSTNIGGSTYGSVTEPTDLGSGGGHGTAGGKGGGAIKLSLGTGTGTITIDGTVSANGGNGTSSYGGGGSGGSVWINAPNGTLDGDGTVTASGGNGYASYSNTCGGGGGRIAVHYSTDSSSLVSNNKLNAYGGAPYSVSVGQRGGAGTVFVKGSSGNGDLLVDGNNLTGVTHAYTTQVTTASQTFDNLTVRNGARYVIPNGYTLTVASGGVVTGGGTRKPAVIVDDGGTFDPGAATFSLSDLDFTLNGTMPSVTGLTFGGTSASVFTYGSATATIAGLTNLTIGNYGTFLKTGTATLAASGTVTVQSGGTLTHDTNTASLINSLIVSASAIDVQTGGSITTVGKGHSPNAGAGAPGKNYAGAGYGGHGGTYSTNIGGTPYGSVTEPADLGSGGGYTGGGRGGGLIWLVVSTSITVDGTVTADGGNGTSSYGGGGSGGSVWINAPGATLAGSGTVTASGGNGYASYSNTCGGGGGRVAVYYSGDSSTLVSGDKIHAYGGKPYSTTTGQRGGSGTVFVKGPSGNGDLLVDGGNLAGTTHALTTQVTTASQTYDNITVRNGARYVIPSGYTLSVASGGNFYGDGTVAPYLTVQSGGTFGGASSFTCSGLINIYNYGAMGGVQDVTLSSGCYFAHDADGGSFPAGLANLTVGSTGTFSQMGTATLAASGTVTIQSGGTLTHEQNNTTSLDHALNVSVPVIDVQTGGSVDVAGKGLNANTGDGAPGVAYAGAGHGGNGGSYSTYTGGSPYGSVKAPSVIGSGGGNTGGGRGGGVVKLTATTSLTVDGTVTANGGNGTSASSGGGSGGSVWLHVPGATLDGDGTVTASGGNGHASTNTAGGGGGRVAVYFSTDSSTLVSGDKLAAYGGAPHSTGTGQRGGAGTVFVKGPTGDGDLIMDGGGVAGTYAETNQIAVETYDSVVVRDGARFVIPDGFSFIVSEPGGFTYGGSPAPALIVESGGTFDPGTATFSLSDLNFTLHGTLSTVTDFTYGGTSAVTFTYGSSTASIPGLVNFTVGNFGTFSQMGTATLAASGTVTVQSGGTLTHEYNTTSPAHALVVSAPVIDIQTGGIVDVNAKGHSANAGPGAPGVNRASAGYGGNGGDGGSGYVGGLPYGSASEPTDIGSGGGNTCGGRGGGAVKLTATTSLTMDGTISANGGNGSSSTGCGGGSGGSVWLHVPGGTLDGDGTVTTNGGNGYNSTVASAGGAGGRVAVHFSTDSSSLVSGSKMNAYGGTPYYGSQRGGAGTVFAKGPSGNGDLLVDGGGLSGTHAYTTQAVDQTYDNMTINGGARYVVPDERSLSVTTFVGGVSSATLTVQSGGTLVPPSSTWSCTAANLIIYNYGSVAVVQNLSLSSGCYFAHDADGGSFPAGLASVTVGDSGTFSQMGTATLAASGTVTVQSGGTLTHEQNATSPVHALVISAATIDVQTGGTVNANSKGFNPNTGPGAPGKPYAGAGHGGNGGTHSSFIGGSPYGSAPEPTNIGSGGGGSGGGRGGGAVKLAASSSLTVDGTVSANGGNGTSSNGTGGGSGGSVWLHVPGATLDGDGTVTATGGNGYNGSLSVAGGGGGRVAVYFSADSSSLVSGGKLTAYGGAPIASGQRGGAGTVFVKGPSGDGDLFVDGGSLSGTHAVTTQADASLTCSDVTVTNGAKYVIPDGYSLSTSSGGIFYGGGTTASSLTIDSGGAASLIFGSETGSLTVSNSGTLNVSGDMILNSGAWSIDGTVTGGLHSLIVKDGATFTWASPTSQLFSGSDLVIESGGTFVQENTTTMEVDTLDVQFGGTLTHCNNSTARACVVDILASVATIAGSVNADYLGYDGSEGDSQGGDAYSGGGAAHGGVGGHGYSSGVSFNNGSATLAGSATAPTEIGSGGGDDTASSGQQAGPGGGAVKIIVVGTLNVTGVISATGRAGVSSRGGGGAGGSVWVQAAVWAGDGSIDADGGAGSGTDTTGGGCGGGGRVYVKYGIKTYSGTATAVSGCSGVRGGGDGTVTEADNTPTIVSFTHDPTSPDTEDSVTLSGSATFDDGLTRLEIYLDGTGPGDLVHACDLSPATTAGSCNYEVGLLSQGDHVATFKAIGVGGVYSTDTDEFSVSYAGGGINNYVSLSRNAASSTGVLTTVGFTLLLEDSQSFTITFPVGFVVTHEFTDGTCTTGDIGSFGYTSSTLTATTSACNGDVVLSGAQVTLPGVAGSYEVSWDGGGAGTASVYVTSDDSVTVAMAVATSLTFSVGATTSACSSSFTPSDWTVAFGLLTGLRPIASSGDSGVKHVCTLLGVNSATGAVVTVENANGSSGLVSASSLDEIPSASAAISDTASNYGMCASSVHGSVGSALDPPAADPIIDLAVSDASCTSALSGNVVGFTGNPQDFWHVTDPTYGAYATLYLKVGISSIQPSHNDYSDQLIFVATATY